MSRTVSNSPSDMGNIIAQVAVLLTHPEQMMHTSPMARKMRRGESPTHFIDMIP